MADIDQCKTILQPLNDDLVAGFSSQGVGKKPCADCVAKNVTALPPTPSIWQQIVGAVKSLDSDIYNALTKTKQKPGTLLAFSANQGPPPKSGSI